ncbi:unnamed protein product, partial [Ostreobium quekettii]
DASSAGFRDEVMDHESLDRTTDVVLSAGAGAKIEAHSQVLALRSGVFRRLFADLGMGSPESKMEVPLGDGTAPRELVELMRCLYSRNVRVDDPAHAARIVHMAEKFDIPFLFEVVEEFMCAPGCLLHCAGFPVGVKLWSHIQSGSLQAKRGDCRDAVAWLDTASRLSMHDLRRKCIVVIIKFLTGVSTVQEQEVVKREMVKQGVQTSDIFDILQAALKVTISGVTVSPSGACQCGGTISPGENVCFHCANSVVRNMQVWAGVSPH